MGLTRLVSRTVLGITAATALAALTGCAPSHAFSAQASTAAPAAYLCAAISNARP